MTKFVVKKFVLICVLASLSTIANAQTAADQAVGLKKAGVQEVDAGLFARGNIAMLVNADGSIVPYVAFESGLIPKSVSAIRIGKMFGGERDAVHFRYVDERGNVQNIQRDTSGSGGGVSDQDVAPLEALVGQPMTQQLVNAGFTPVGTQKMVWNRDVDGHRVVVTLKNEVVTGIYKPADRLEGKLKGAVVIGYSEEKDQWGNVDSAIRVRNAFTKFDVIAKYSGDIGNVEFFKDLKDVELSDLGFKAPDVKQDPVNGFKIGATNPTDLILKLLGLGGFSVERIEEGARKVDGCSHGDKLLASGESLVQVMADDNEKVQKLGRTHQELAKPFLYAQAMLAGGYGDQFKLYGADYKVSQGPSPMCGSLKSPFNDGYSTSISFLKITNLKTSKAVEYSKLHPYLINQYGFYGSHQNRSYVNPDKIVEVFDYLKK